jgi:hypothetical protein
MNNRRLFIKNNDINTNYSTIYLLPILGYKNSFFRKDSDGDYKDLISVYLLEDTQKKMVLCFDNSSDEDFKGTMYQLQQNKDFISIDYADNNNEVVCVFKIPEDREIDYNLFKIGRYTKFSNEYKDMLVEYHGKKSGDGKCIMMIDSLYPSHLAKKYRADKMSALFPGSIPVSINDLPGGEVMSICDNDREMYVETDNLKLKEEVKID